MSKFTLFGEEVEFSKAADRYYKMLKVFEVAVEGASDTFINFYNNSEGILDVLDNYADALYEISKNVAVEPLFKTLINLEIYDVSKESFEDACWDLSGAEPYYDEIVEIYNQIVGAEENARNYRAIRKATRGRWVGGGFSVGGAIKGAVTAGAMNAVTGFGHSIVNSIGNLRSSSDAITAKVELYNDETTLEILDKGVRECIEDIFLLFMNFVNEYKENEGEDVWYDGSVYSSEKADTLLKNSSIVENKEKELLFKAFCVCPYHYNLLSSIFLKYEEERQNVFEIAKYYKLDLSPLFNIIIMMIYDEEAQQSDEKAFEAKKKIEEFMSEYDIKENDTLDQLEQDCLTRYSKEYLKLLPEETTEFIEGFERYNAIDKNKAVIVEKFNIWELFENYNINCSNDSMEEIISNFIDLAQDRKDIDFDTIVRKAHIILNQLSFPQSDTLNNYEYDKISEIAKDYSITPVGKAERIIAQIEKSTVSERIKAKYVYENNVWELFQKYKISISEDEKIEILYSCYQKIDQLQKISMDEKKAILIPIIDVLLAIDNSYVNFSENKTDTMLYVQIAQKIKECFTKANTYGDKNEKYWHIGFLGDTNREVKNSVWAYGDTGFVQLLTELWDDMPDDEDEINIKDVLFIFSEQVDDKRKVYTFLTCDKIYSMKKGNPVYFLTFDDFKMVSSNGLLSLKDDNALINVFFSEDRSNPECEALATAFNQTIEIIKKSIKEKSIMLNHLKAYYDYIQKISKGYDAEEPSFFHEPSQKAKQSPNSAAREQISTITKQALINWVDTLIEKYNVGSRYFSSTTSKFVSKLPKAIKQYANLSSDEIPLILEDATLFGSGKEGFVLTNRNIYINNMVDKKIKLSWQQLTQIGYIEAGASSFYTAFGTAEYNYKTSFSSDINTTINRVNFLIELKNILTSYTIVS